MTITLIILSVVLSVVAHVMAIVSGYDGSTCWINIDTFIGNNNNSITYFMNGETINDIPTAGGGEKPYTFLG